METIIVQDTDAGVLDVPIIALSCNQNIHTVAPAVGFDDYIKKPFDIDLLYEILRKHIPPHSTGPDHEYKNP